MFGENSFGQVSLTDLSFSYRVSERIKSVQTTSKFAFLLIEGSKLLLKYDLRNGLMIENIKFPKGIFFLYHDSHFYFLKKKQLIKMNLEGEEKTVKLEEEFQVFWLNKNVN